MKPFEPPHPDSTGSIHRQPPAWGPTPALTAGAESPCPRKRRRLWPWGALLLAILAIPLAGLLAPPREPSYRGKSARHWLVDGYAVGGWLAENPAKRQAFKAMGGQAVPFLMEALGKSRPSLLERAYGVIFKGVPATLAKWLPQPTTDAFYQFRRIQALEMLAMIGEAQRFRCLEQGHPASEASATNALPVLEAAFQDPNSSIRWGAAQVIEGLGFLAAPLVPDLMSIVADPKAPGRTQALRALGAMGASASNAVPILVQLIARDQRHGGPATAPPRGRNGSPTGAVAPVPTGAQVEPAAALRPWALRALSQIGSTPAEAVPMLTALTRESDGDIRAHACLALWNRDRQNENLRQEILAGLRSPDGGRLLFSLGILGSNAAPFAAEIQAVAEGPQNDRYVKKVLRQIQP